MVCRNPNTGAEARQELMETSGNNNLHLHILDLSKPRDIAAFVKKFGEENSKLDVLINNAGCMVNTRLTNEEGLDMNFATNVLGTFMLTSGLLPLLGQSDQPRVVTVSSGGMLVQALDVTDLQFEKVRIRDRDRVSVLHCVMCCRWRDMTGRWSTLRTRGSGWR